MPILMLALCLAACTDKGAGTDSSAPGDGGTEDGGAMDGGVEDGGTPDGGTEDGGSGDGGDDGGAVDVDWAEYTVTADLDSDTLTADGWTETVVHLVAVDGAGNPPPDGADIPLKTNRGTIESISPTSSGAAEALLKAGTWPGTGELSVVGGTVEGETTFSLVRGTPTSVQLHLHGSVSEGAGTMRGHVEQAEETGVDLLWWTDHDYSYYRDHSYELTGYDFESGALTSQMVLWPSDDVQDVTWVQVTDELDSESSAVSADAARSGSYGWRLQGSAVSAEGGESRYRIVMTPRLNFKTLLSQVDFSFAFRPQVDADGAEAFITIPLSGRRAGNDDQYEDPYHKVHFVWSTTEYENTEYDYYVPIDATVGEWTELSVDLSTLVEESFPDVGLDLHAEFVDVAIRSTDGQDVQVDVDDFSWSQVVVGEDLMEVQRDFLDEIDSPVQHLVGYELSYLREGHLNAYGTDLPLLPYTDSDSWTATEAVDWVHSYGGIASHNHMFGVTGADYDDVETLALIDEITDVLLATDAYHCDMIEVGYRTRGGETQDFLTVWDNLGMANLFITGEGSSDLHGKQSWATNDNNFVTWVVGASPTEEQLMHNLERGSAFFGDASVFRDGDVVVELTVPDAEATMGQVVEGLTEETDVVFIADPLDQGWLVRAVEDGEVIDEWTVAEGENRFERTVSVDPTGGKLVRFEVWTRDPEEGGIGLLFTNPVYFVDAGTTVPGERIPVP